MKHTEQTRGVVTHRVVLDDAEVMEAVIEYVRKKFDVPNNYQIDFDTGCCSLSDAEVRWEVVTT